MSSYVVDVRISAEPVDVVAAWRSLRTSAVTISPGAKDTDPTAWSVPFGPHPLRWHQQEVWRTDVDEVTGEFEQFDGPFSTFVAGLRCVRAGHSSVISYRVHFTTCVPNWAGAVDRAIGSAILRAAVSVLDSVSTEPVVVLAGSDQLIDPEVISATTNHSTSAPV